VLLEPVNQHARRREPSTQLTPRHRNLYGSRLTNRTGCVVTFAIPCPSTDSDKEGCKGSADEPAFC
jgi:hypothetical protein